MGRNGGRKQEGGRFELRSWPLKRGESKTGRGREECGW